MSARHRQSQRLPLLAIGLVAAAIAPIMAPAACHRQTEPQHASERFLHLSMRLLLASMPPLAIATCLDFYLLARLVLHDSWIACCAGALFACTSACNSCCRALHGPGVGSRRAGALAVIRTMHPR